MTMPEAVFFSSSRSLTITRSCNGRIFIVTPLMLGLGRARGAVNQQNRGKLRRIAGARGRLVLPVLVLEQLDQAVDAARAHDARERLAVGEHQADTGDL